MSIDYRFRIDRLETLFASIAQGWVQSQIPYRDFALPALDPVLWEMRVGARVGLEYLQLLQPTASKIVSVNIVGVRIVPGTAILAQHPEGTDTVSLDSPRVEFSAVLHLVEASELADGGQAISTEVVQTPSTTAIGMRWVVDLQFDQPMAPTTARVFSLRSSAFDVALAIQSEGAVLQVPWRDVARPNTMVPWDRSWIANLIASTSSVMVSSLPQLLLLTPFPSAARTVGIKLGRDILAIREDFDLPASAQFFVPRGMGPAAPVAGALVYREPPSEWIGRWRSFPEPVQMGDAEDYVVFYDGKYVATSFAMTVSLFLAVSAASRPLRAAVFPVQIVSVEPVWGEQAVVVVRAKISQLCPLADFDVWATISIAVRPAISTGNALAFVLGVSVDLDNDDVGACATLISLFNPFGVGFGFLEALPFDFSVQLATQLRNASAVVNAATTSGMGMPPAPTPNLQFATSGMLPGTNLAPNEVAWTFMVAPGASSATAGAYGPLAGTPATRAFGTGVGFGVAGAVLGVQSPPYRPSPPRIVAALTSPVGLFPLFNRATCEMTGVSLRFTIQNTSPMPTVVSTPRCAGSALWCAAFASGIALWRSSDLPPSGILAPSQSATFSLDLLLADLIDLISRSRLDDSLLIRIETGTGVAGVYWRDVLHNFRGDISARVAEFEQWCRQGPSQFQMSPPMVGNRMGGGGGLSQLTPPFLGRSDTATALVDQYRRERIESRYLLNPVGAPVNTPNSARSLSGADLSAQFNHQLQPWESGIPLPSTAYDTNPGVFALLIQSVTQHR